MSVLHKKVGYDQHLPTLTPGGICPGMPCATWMPAGKPAGAPDRGGGGGGGPEGPVWLSVVLLLVDVVCVAWKVTSTIILSVCVQQLTEICLTMSRNDHKIFQAFMNHVTYESVQVQFLSYPWAWRNGQWSDFMRTYLTESSDVSEWVFPSSLLFLWRQHVLKEWYLQKHWNLMMKL